jgi:hypothetical protein
MEEVQREMSLYEYVSQLPRCHRARKELVALLARLPGDEWSNEEAEFCYDSSAPVDPLNE